MYPLRTLLLSSIAASSLVTIAVADDDVPPASTAPAGQYASLRGVQGPAGMFTPLGWQVPPGTSLCLTGTDNGCPHVYNNLGFDLMYGVLFGSTDLSLHGSLFFDSLDPFQTSLAVGFAGKQHFTDNVTLLFDPKIQIALNDRDVAGDAMYVPLELGYQLGAPNLVKVLSGIYGPLSGFGDAYRIPVGLGFIRNLNPHFDLGVRFSFDNLLGSEAPNVGRADERSLAVLLNVRS